MSSDAQLVPREGRQVPEGVGVRVPGEVRGGGAKGSLGVGAVLDLPVDDGTPAARPRV